MRILVNLNYQVMLVMKELALILRMIVYFFFLKVVLDLLLYKICVKFELKKTFFLTGPH